TRRVLGHVLDELLRVLHPIIPFVTEELWIALTRGPETVDGSHSIVVAAWPTADASYLDDAAEADVAALQRVVTEVRRFRADQGVKPGQRVRAGLPGRGGLGAHEPLIRALARLDEVPEGPEGPEGFDPTATLSVGGGVGVELDTRGSIDV